MDSHNRKYGLVLDIIEHPHKYSTQELDEILSDPETREIYNLLCKTDSAMNAKKEIDIESEWNSFSGKHFGAPRRRNFLWIGNRAASIAVIICSSIVAVAAGIAVTMAVIEHKPAASQGSDAEAIRSYTVAASDTIKTKNDSVKVEKKPVMFEDESLEVIMEAVAKAYDVKIKFNSKEAAALHLYYKFDPSLPIDDVVEQLNTFERINIKRNKDTLIID